MEKTYREKLVMLVEAIGRELQVNAESIVPAPPHLRDFHIVLKFANDGGHVYPEMVIESTHFSEEVRELMMNHFQTTEK